jgi:hypothetical protein
MGLFWFGAKSGFASHSPKSALRSKNVKQKPRFIFVCGLSSLIATH